MRFIECEAFDTLTSGGITSEFLTQDARLELKQEGIDCPCVVTKKTLRWMPEDRPTVDYDVWQFAGGVYVIGRNAPEWVIPALQQLG